MIRSRLLAPLLTACALQLALPNTVAAQTTQASADETARARELFRQGAAAMKDGKFQEARKALLQVWTFRQSYDVAAVLGQAELELKAYRDAAEHLDFALRNLAPRESAETLANIKNGLATAKQHVAEIRLTVNEPNSRITIDGTEAGVSPLSGSLYVDPGEHLFQARLDTDRVAKQTIQASSGSTYTIELTVPPPPLTGPSAPGSGLGAPPAPAPPVDSTGNQPSIVPLIVGGSIVAISAGLGIGYRIAAASKKDELETLKSTNGRDACATEASGVDCSAQRDAVRSVDARRNVSTASFVVAGAALVGTAVYWFWPRSHAERAAKRSNFIVTGAPTAHGGSMFLSGSF
jgi:hypothetical protein